jgi:hypothetical protein
LKGASRRASLKNDSSRRWNCSAQSGVRGPTTPPGPRAGQLYGHELLQRDLAQQRMIEREVDDAEAADAERSKDLELVEASSGGQQARAVGNGGRRGRGGCRERHRRGSGTSLLRRPGCILKGTPTAARPARPGALCRDTESRACPPRGTPGAPAPMKNPSGSQEIQVSARGIYRGYTFADVSTPVENGRYRARVAIMALDGSRTRSQRFIDLEVFPTLEEAGARVVAVARAWIDANEGHDQLALPTNFAPMD